MIGNDIVDLRQAARDSNWRRKGYLDKLFTTAEQVLISRAHNPDLMVWLLWSMKESAYKIDSRKTGLRSFAPSKLVCDHIVIHGHHATGSVNYETKLYYTSSKFNSNYIHTIAAGGQEMLQNIAVKITKPYLDYRSNDPQCVSHHGRYLALAYYKSSRFSSISKLMIPSTMPTFGT